MKWLHYIGKGSYTTKSFISEAKKIGINRAVPRFMLKQIRPGDTIFLATYTKNKKTLREKATVFGAFKADTLTLPAAISARLEETGLITTFLSAVPDVVARGCGSYSIAGSYTPTVDTQTLWKAIAEINDIDVKNLFLSGRFYELTPFDIDAISFTRGYTRVDDYVQNLEIGEFPAQSQYGNIIENYKKGGTAGHGRRSKRRNTKRNPAGEQTTIC